MEFDMKKRIDKFTILISLTLVCLMACSKVEEVNHQDYDYGHVQFKLYKEAAYPSTKSLDNLGDIAKVKVTMDFEGKQISQTLVLSAADAKAAEYGLRSE